MKNYKSITFFTLLLIFSGCGIFDSNNQDESGFPNTPEEIKEQVSINREITNQSTAIINQEINQAYNSNSFIDLEKLAESIKGIDNVKSTSISESGNVITVESSSGTFTNHIVIRRDDDRLFEEIQDQTKRIDDNYISPSNIVDYQNLINTENFPQGDGKALILSPFQDDFGERVDLLSFLFQSAGFSVDIFINNEADLDKFRANFLGQYDIIYIATHGGADAKIRSGLSSSILLTGEVLNETRDLALTTEERKSIALGGSNGNSYYSISVQWLAETISEQFPNSWIFANACESIKRISGSGSLSASFFEHGAGGYSGFKENISNSMAKSIGEKLTALMTSGLDLEAASDDTRNDFGLRTKAWLIRVNPFIDSSIKQSSRVEHLGNVQNISDSFYLFDPDKVVGVAKLVPSSGTPGTNVVYEVAIGNNFADLVTRIEFDIDNTGENLNMTQVNSTLWRRDGLSAPTANNYPRVDTFTFSAFNNSNDLVGQGSATFTIYEPNSPSKSKIVSNKYFEQN